jgi:hypothetical protein
MPLLGESRLGIFAAESLRREIPEELKSQAIGDGSGANKGVSK